MKGILFTEFVDMVEDKFGIEVLDQIIEGANIPSKGAYTSVSTYDFSEMVALVEQLSKVSGITSGELTSTFGQHLLVRFFQQYPFFFEGVSSTFDFLSTIESHVHVEVRKLYDHAELPTFETSRLSEGSFLMTYRSSRPFADLAEGLIRGAIDHFRENITIERIDLSDTNNHSEFLLEKIE